MPVLERAQPDAADGYHKECPLPHPQDAPVVLLAEGEGFAERNVSAMTSAYASPRAAPCRRSRTSWGASTAPSRTSTRPTGLSSASPGRPIPHDGLDPQPRRP